MTSAVLAPEPLFDAWWTCPRWCTTCYGGDVDLGAGHAVTIPRLHRHTFVDLRAADDDHRHADVQVAVVVERADDPDEVGDVNAVLRVGGYGGRLSRAQRHQLAAALLAVDDVVPELI